MKAALFCLLAAGGWAALSVAPAAPRGRPAKAAPPAAPAPAAPAAGPRADLGKLAVEQPVKQVLAGQFGNFGGQFGNFGGAPAPAPAARPAAEDFVNPKVEPGKVQWHADLEAACKAAARSGKPVLLFQMMGNLDEQFC
jgi:hypothetical protein